MEPEKLDPETTEVPELARSHEQLVARTALVEARLQRAEGHIDQQLHERQIMAQGVAHQQTVGEIYTACDEEFGAQFRNDAIKRADQLVADGAVDKPVTPVQGVKLMRQCYADVAAQAKPKDEPKKKTVPTDTGLRGLSVTDLEDSEEFKTGTLDEVAADMGKKMKAGKWDGKRFASDGM